MPVQLNNDDSGNVLVVHVSGKLAAADYEYFVPEFERLAVIGEKRWQEGMATFCKPFTKALVRYFDHADAAEARQWCGASAQGYNRARAGSQSQGLVRFDAATRQASPSTLRGPGAPGCSGI